MNVRLDCALLWPLAPSESFHPVEAPSGDQLSGAVPEPPPRAFSFVASEGAAAEPPENGLVSLGVGAGPAAQDDSEAAVFPLQRRLVSPQFKHPGTAASTQAKPGTQWSRQSRLWSGFSRLLALVHHGTVSKSCRQCFRYRQDPASCHPLLPPPPAPCAARPGLVGGL